MNITPNVHSQNPYYDLANTIFQKLKPHFPRCGEGFGVTIRIIHNDRHLCFNCFAREILYAIEECINISLFPIFQTKILVFQENLWGKALNVPISKIKNHLDLISFEKFDSYFFRFYKQRILLLESHYLKINKDIQHLIIQKDEAFNHYNIVFQLSILTFDIKKIIRKYLVCNYESLYKLRKEFDAIK
tara:strand:- start:5133 stop:5696 length:564 start_codon:yes stop_codon:yes gene_type:complete